jgi:shikimate dehydrogenase
MVSATRWRDDRRMQRVGLIGHPIEQSVSPAFQQAAFDELGLDVRYEAWDTLPEGLEQRIAFLRDEAVLGANVTVPHKEAVMGYVDDIDAVVGVVGAVNTVVHRDGRLVGHNTDVSGFTGACAGAGVDLSLRPAVVIGAGGAARAVTYALTQESLKSILVLNRSIDRARRLAVDLGVGCDTLAEAPASVYRTARIVINATPVGMRYGADEVPLDPTSLTPGCVVIDLVANPPQTRFLREAEAAGCMVLGGLPMLVRQGADSFRLWTGREAPIDTMMRVARERTEAFRAA